jgi:RecJ-like exonuclease
MLDLLHRIFNYECDGCRLREEIIASLRGDISIEQVEHSNVNRMLIDKQTEFLYYVQNEKQKYEDLLLKVTNIVRPETQQNESTFQPVARQSWRKIKADLEAQATQAYWEKKQEESQKKHDEGLGDASIINKTEANDGNSETQSDEAILAE